MANLVLDELDQELDRRGLRFVRYADVCNAGDRRPRGEAGTLNRTTRVVALTAGATTEEREACRAAGRDGFLAKPVRHGDLIETLRSVPGAPRA